MGKGAEGVFSHFFSFFFLNLQFNNIIFFFLKKDKSRRYQEPGLAKGPQADSRRVEGNTEAAGREQGHRLLRQSHGSSAPHHALLYTRVPPWLCCALALGSEGKGKVQESGKMQRGPIFNTIPALQDLTLARGSFMAQGRLSITAPPDQPSSTRDVQPHCKWLLSKHQPQGPGKRRVSVLCQTPTHGIW